MPDEQAVTVIDFQHIPFANLTDTPTTCAGYGITDGGGSTVWGAIQGTLASQTDLAGVLNGKAASSHAHVISDTTGLQTALDGKLATTVLSGLSKITVGTSAPGSPTTGDLWIDTN